MGLGDAKLALSVGFVLGISGGVAAILLSFWIGTIAALLIILVQRLRGGKRLGLKSEIPFGPYILIGFLVVLLFHIDMQAIFSLLAV